MHYGSIYEYGDSYKLEFPKKMDACYSTFLHDYRYRPLKKYLHIYFNPYPEFTFKEIENLLKYLRKDLKFTLRKFKPAKNRDYKLGEHKTKFLKDTIYPVITIRTSDLSLGEIKFLYYFIRIFHEADHYVENTRKVIKAKKLLPNEEIINLLVFFNISSASLISGHLFVDVWYNKNKFTKFTSLREFLDRYVTDKYFKPVEFERIKNKSFEELIEIYKNI